MSVEDDGTALVYVKVGDKLTLVGGEPVLAAPPCRGAAVHAWLAWQPISGHALLTPRANPSAAWLGPTETLG